MRDPNDPESHILPEDYDEDNPWTADWGSPARTEDLMIHEKEPIGCIFEYDRGRWVQVRSNIPEPEPGALIDGERWVSNHEAVCHGEGIVIMRQLVPAFGRARLEVRDDDGASVSSSYRMGRDWLLKFGFDEDGSVIDDPATGRLLRRGTEIRYTVSWPRRLRSPIDGSSKVKTMLFDRREAEAVADFILAEIGEQVGKPTDVERAGDGWTVKGSKLVIKLEVVR